ncbi:DNA gyrase subunit B [Streptomyces sp. NPDC005017]|uniref:DNA gyrase subunit B n=1 Tax=Streptomyces sp. NPDC005017 TaxID=3364706 RepID=UPI003676A00C
MYVGSTGERGLHELVFAVVGRAVNQVLAEGGDSIDVTLTPDGGVRVTDDAPGGSFEAAADSAGPGLEALLTTLHMGCRAPVDRRVAHVGIGTGLFVANALSSRLTAEVRCAGERRVQVHARGVAVTSPAAAGPASGHGTAIAFWPDSEIFETTRCSFAVLAERFRQIAFLNRGLGISLTDERPAGGTRAVRFRFPDGVRDFVAALAAETGSALDPGVIGFEREDTRMAGRMEVALLWSGSREGRVRGFANSRATPEGGTHLDGFRDGVAAAVTAYAREQRLLAAGDPGPDADRITDGLTAVVSVALDQPEFRGSTRGQLGNTEVRLCVAESVREHLADWFEEHSEQAAEFVGRLLRAGRQD